MEFVDQVLGEPAPERAPEHGMDEAFVQQVWAALHDVFDDEGDLVLDVLVKGLSPGERVAAWEQAVYDDGRAILASQLRYSENVPTLVTALRAWRGRRG